jgi:hypothetical protein
LVIIIQFGQNKQFCETGNIRFESRPSGSKHLQQDDIDFIRFLKTHRPSMSTGELYTHLNEFGNVVSGTSYSGVRRVLKYHMDDGEWSWKRLTHSVQEKYTAANLAYCQEFINYVHTIDPHD